jgi:hypothetical protein
MQYFSKNSGNKKNGSQEIAIQYQTIKTAINIEKYLSN